MCYAQRVRWERQVKLSPAYRPKEFLSTNSKTGTSLNLPVINCRPSARCAQACYACTGPISWHNSITKSLAVDAELKAGRVERLIEEARRLTNVRISGSGDLTLEQVPAIIRAARSCPGTLFWGFTRKPEVARALHRKARNLTIILSFDASSKDRSFRGYRGPLAFGPRRPEDAVPSDRRIVVVFPEHIQGHTTKGVPRHRLDCPTSRGAEHDNACEKCQRCWRP
ncbi:MAG: hypothetical protein ABFE07_29265 [Armatimonadia bacterium]